ncbi:MAG: EAL domain-containing protein [Gallionella sp.]|jgi:diguanylate cyclase (GGDEF)-like protein/PAS domain S-box-containing protein
MNWLLEPLNFNLLGIGLLLLLGVVTATFWLARTNQHLKESYRERERLDRELQLANATLEEKVVLRTQELEASEARFRSMLESSPIAVRVADGGGRHVVFANQRYRELINVGSDHAEPIDPRSYYVHPEVYDETLQQLAQGLVVTDKLVELTIPEQGVKWTLASYLSFRFEGQEAVLGWFYDITERHLLEEQMHDLAFYDPLTKLPNRRLLVDRLDKALAASSRNKRHGALMFLDLDHFKVLNDLHGHDIGDQLLMAVSSRILGCIREQDSAARFGGDEFVVMLEGLSEHLNDAVTQADGVAEKIRAALSQPYLLNRGDDVISHHCSSSIGVTVFCDQKDNLEQLLKWTDMAMYHAKDAGRNVIRFFDPDMQTAIETRAALEADLHTALEQRQFQLFYQIQVDTDGKSQGAEALLRWRHPQRGLVSPAQFIPLAEGTGLIVPIGAWVLDTVCAQIALWASQSLTCNLVIAVNVSAKQFRQADFVSQVKKTVQQHGIQPARLKLELTESLVLDNVEDAIAKMHALKVFGVSFSMDDFGTGYSSLSYLKQLPLDQIKIDQSFVRDITTDKTDLVMVKTIVDLGGNFEMDVIAEGVETEAQLQYLKQCGCANFQGYLFSKPVPLEEFEELLQRGVS